MYSWAGHVGPTFETAACLGLCKPSKQTSYVAGCAPWFARFVQALPPRLFILFYFYDIDIKSNTPSRGSVDIGEMGSIS